MPALKIEVGGENIINHIIQIMPINEVASLVTRVHGNPAELVATHIVLHVSPHWLSLDRDWLLIGKQKQFASCVNFNSLSEELTYNEN